MLAQPTLENLIEANRGFYQTFESLDLKTMIALWEESERVYCVHPGWNALTGYDAVIQSWRGIFANTTAMQFDLKNVQAHLEGDLGIVTLEEHIRTQAGAELMAATASVTNLFAFDPSIGHWRIFHHHASNAVPDRPPTPNVLN